jgi:5'-deoxynucleotidase YfbR-like HD superfamily hydrolase
LAIVHLSINFDHECYLMAVEVNYKALYHDLTPEVVTGDAVGPQA